MAFLARLATQMAAKMALPKDVETPIYSGRRPFGVGDFRVFYLGALGQPRPAGSEHLNHACGSAINENL